MVLLIVDLFVGAFIRQTDRPLKDSIIAVIARGIRWVEKFAVSKPRRYYL